MFSQGFATEYVALPARSGSDSPPAGNPAGRDGLDWLTRLVNNVAIVMTGTPVESFFVLEPGTLNSANRQ